MKKMLTLFCLSIFSFTFSQTAEEIIRKYVEVSGGINKVNNIKNFHSSAKVEQMGMTIPVDIYTTSEGKMLIKVVVQGMEFVQMAFDGKESWGTNFMTMKPEKSSSEESENMKRNSKDFMSPLFNYKEKGYQIEKMSDETVEGVSCFKLKVSKGTLLDNSAEVQNIDYFYIDKENYLLILQESEITSGEMKGKMEQSVFSDYQEINGVLFPFSMTSRIKDVGGQTIQFDKIETNITLDEKMFSFPEQ
ncbi:MAG: outer membrane lipoprotein-sorting protein [Flavobacteriia bacterium]|nr:outer membrane lipoprotein-sorting protein [Flavobacteriia bacterium]